MAKKPKSKGMNVTHIKNLKKTAAKKAVEMVKERRSFVDSAWLIVYTLAVIFVTLLLRH